MRSFRLIGLAPLVFLLGCAQENSGVLEDLTQRNVTLPDGRLIRAEVMIKPADMERGMMYRDSLPQGHGVLFVHNKLGPYRYWMNNVKIPLDIIFMDDAKRIVEIAADTPPCTSKPSECPLYGGHHMEMFVLELAGGEARRFSLREGQTLTF